MQIRLPHRISLLPLLAAVTFSIPADGAVPIYDVVSIGPMIDGATAGAAVAAGVYFTRLDANGMSTTRRLIVSR